MISTIGFQASPPRGPSQAELEATDTESRSLSWYLLGSHALLGFLLWRLTGSPPIAAGTVLGLMAFEALVIDVTMFLPFCVAITLLMPTSTFADDHTAREPINLTYADGQLVFSPGDEDDWDAAIRERGWILKEGDTYRMWYTGYDGTRKGVKHLGLATSPDGVTWTRHADNPIYEETWVEDMQVIRHDGRYLMFAEGAGGHSELLISDDGVKWTWVGKIDIRKVSGEPVTNRPCGTPTAYFEEGTWYLFYEQYDLGIWLATSTGLKTFTNVQDDPVLTLGPHEYDKLQVALNQIVKQGDTYYAFYHGTGTPKRPRDWCTCVATSTDLIHWTKHEDNPLFPVSQNKSSGILVHDGEDWRLYTMHDKVHLHLSVHETGNQSP